MAPVNGESERKRGGGAGGFPNEWMQMANATTCGCKLIFTGDCNLERTKDCIRQHN